MIAMIIIAASFIILFLYTFVRIIYKFSIPENQKVFISDNKKIDDKVLDEQAVKKRKTRDKTLVQCSIIEKEKPKVEIIIEKEELNLPKIPHKIKWK